MKAYRARVWRADGKPLIGGVRVHESFPMQTQKMAADWAETVTRENARAFPAVHAFLGFGREVSECECRNPIMESEVQS